MLLDAPPKLRGSDFAHLNRLIDGAGLLRRRPGYYAVRLALVAAAYVGGLGPSSCSAIRGGSYWWPRSWASCSPRRHWWRTTSRTGRSSGPGG
jgi:hypothetical protein